MYTYPIIVMGLRGSLWAIVVVQSVAALPLVFRPLHDGFLRVPVPLYLAARSLGAGPWRTFWQLELPLPVALLDQEKSCRVGRDALT